MRYLGIDYGTRRIGTALGDSTTGIATPWRIVVSRNDPTRDARAITDLGAAEAVDAFVVGLPLSMNDGESDQTRLTRRFASELARLSAKPVHEQDERLTSYAAEEIGEQLGGSVRGRRKPIDAIAAQKILQAWLDARPRDAHNPPASDA